MDKKDILVIVFTAIIVVGVAGFWEFSSESAVAGQAIGGTDTDGDGYSDFVEKNAGTGVNDASSYPSSSGICAPGRSGECAAKPEISILEESISLRLEGEVKVDKIAGTFSSSLLMPYFACGFKNGGGSDTGAAGRHRCYIEDFDLTSGATYLGDLEIKLNSVDILSGDSIEYELKIMDNYIAEGDILQVDCTASGYYLAQCELIESYYDNGNSQTTTVTYEVDLDGEIDEQNENNNVGEVQIEVDMSGVTFIECAVDEDCLEFETCSETFMCEALDFIMDDNSVLS